MSRIFASVSRMIQSRQPTRAEPLVGQGPATAQDLGAAIRFLVVLFAIGALGAVKLAVASEAQQTSLRLDHARSEVRRAEIQRERLLVERAMLRQPGRLQAAADQLGLVAPVAVVSMPAETP